MFLESMFETGHEKLAWVRNTMRAFGFEVVERPLPFCFELQGGRGGMDAVPGFHGLYMFQMDVVLHTTYKKAALWHELCHSQQPSGQFVLVSDGEIPEGYHDNVAETQARCIELAFLLEDHELQAFIQNNVDAIGDAEQLENRLYLVL